MAAWVRKMALDPSLWEPFTPTEAPPDFRSCFIPYFLDFSTFTAKE